MVNLLTFRFESFFFSVCLNLLDFHLSLIVSSLSLLQFAINKNESELMFCFAQTLQIEFF